MKISGLQKLTLLDYPGKMAAIIFCAGCNFICPFCQNSELVLSPQNAPSIEKDELFSFLNKRKKILDGIVITGGEPLIYEETYELIREIKDLGYLVKLDTNGSFPERLKRLIDDRLVDYVAMDIKNSKAKYAKTTGRDKTDTDLIEESINILLSGKVEYEFRTTVIKELHTEQDFNEIGKWIMGAKHYYLQAYRDSENVISRRFTPPEKSFLGRVKAIVEPFVANVELRGID